MKTKSALMSSSLKASVQDLYKAFKGYHAPKEHLDVCSCCMDIERQKEMMAVPLEQVPASLFYEYNDSAKSENQPANEIKYFLPRMIEVFAEGAEIHHSVELYLSRLGNCAKEAISDEQRRAINSFALKFFDEYLKCAPWNKPEWSQFDNAFSLLLMFDIGGIEIQPLLELWLKDTSHESTLHYVESSHYDFWDSLTIENAFATDRPEFQKKMWAWMLNSRNQMIFHQRIKKLINTNFDSQYEKWFVGVNRAPTHLIDRVIKKLQENL